LLFVVGKTMVADPQELGLYYQSYYGVGSDAWDDNPQSYLTAQFRTMLVWQ
jgi:hypothetical protein